MDVCFKRLFFFLSRDGMLTDGTSIQNTRGRIERDKLDVLAFGGLQVKSVLLLSVSNTDTTHHHASAGFGPLAHDFMSSCDCPELAFTQLGTELPRTSPDRHCWV